MKRSDSFIESVNLFSLNPYKIQSHSSLVSLNFDVFI